MHSSDLAGHPLYHVTSSQLCTSIYEGASSFDLLVCSLPVHGPGIDHACVGDDGSVLAIWPVERGARQLFGESATPVGRAS